MVLPWWVCSYPADATNLHGHFPNTGVKGHITSNLDPPFHELAYRDKAPTMYFEAICYS